MAGWDIVLDILQQYTPSYHIPAYLPPSPPHLPPHSAMVAASTSSNLLCAANLPATFSPFLPTTPLFLSILPCDFISYLLWQLDRMGSQTGRLRRWMGWFPFLILFQAMADKWAVRRTRRATLALTHPHFCPLHTLPHPTAIHACRAFWHSSSLSPMPHACMPATCLPALFPSLPFYSLHTHHPCCCCASSMSLPTSLSYSPPFYTLPVHMLQAGVGRQDGWLDGCGGRRSYSGGGGRKEEGQEVPVFCVVNSISPICLCSFVGRPHRQCVVASGGGGSSWWFIQTGTHSSRQNRRNRGTSPSVVVAGPGLGTGD